jgi:hypothetical protein
VKADGFLVMARGSPEEIARAKDILSTMNPSHANVHAFGPADHASSAG